MSLADVNRLATIHWQHDLSQFFLDRVEPNYAELNMYAAGFNYRNQEIEKLKKDNDNLRKALEHGVQWFRGLPQDEMPDVAKKLVKALEES